MFLYKFKNTVMKKNILKVLAVSTFAVVVLFNVSLNAKSKSINVKLSQEAQASYICAEYALGGGVCCITDNPGGCNTGWGDYEGPYYWY